MPLGRTVRNAMIRRPIMWAIEQGHVETTQTLLVSGRVNIGFMDQEYSSDTCDYRPACPIG